MGAWGAGIFADDDAADVREDFRHYMADLRTVEAATEAIALDYGASLERPRDHTAFWLGLALTQWKAGWLDPRVKAAALGVIEDGSDLAKWSAADAKKRVKALAGAKVQLETPPPPPKPVPAPWPDQLADFQVGEVIGRALPNGRLAVMKVVGRRRTTALKVKGPAVALQKWTRPTMPSAQEAAGLEFLRWPIAPNRKQTFGHLVLTAPREAPLDPGLFLRPGLVVPLTPGEERSSYHCVSTWAKFTLDDILAAGIERFWDDPALDARAYAPWYKPNPPKVG
jgi:hypothetical protein